MTPKAHAFHLLTETERNCLRLVHEGHSSKNIATYRNVRPDRIDKILNSARMKLGGVPRRDAARLLVEYESANRRENPRLQPTSEIAQSLGAQPLGVVNPTPALPPEPADMPTAAAKAGDLSEAWADDPSTPQRPALALSLSFGGGGRQRNDLNQRTRLMTIAVIAAAGALIAGGALALLIVLDQIGLSH